MSERRDVCVVGGGVMGLSTAYYLTKEGKSVTLLEKKEIGAGASGACDEMIMLQSKNPGISLELAMESLELYKGLEKELEQEIGFKNEGGTVLIEDYQQLDAMKAHMELQKKVGLEVEIIDRDELLKYQPMVSEDIIASTYCAQDGQVDPLMLMQGFLNKGLENGLKVKRGVYPTNINKNNGIWKVKLSNGEEIICDNVVNAAGAWSPEVGKLVGIDIPIEPRRGQIAITEPVPDMGIVTLTAGYIASKLDPSLIPDKGEYAKSIGLGFALSQTVEGNVLIGSTREDAGFDKTTSVKSLSVVIEQALEYFPVLRDVNIIRTISGFRPATKDGNPIIGEVDGLDGFYIASGHEGDGIALSPITGKKIADMILDRNYDDRMEQLNLRRFTN